LESTPRFFVQQHNRQNLLANNLSPKNLIRPRWGSVRGGPAVGGRPPRRHSETINYPRKKTYLKKENKKRIYDFYT
jgi:hypothetical protein